MIFKSKIFVMAFLKILFYICGFKCLYIDMEMICRLPVERMTVCPLYTLFSFDLCRSIHLQSDFWVDLHVKPRECYSVLGVHTAGVKIIIFIQLQI